MKIFLVVLTLLLELFLFSSLKVAGEVSRREEYYDESD